MFSPLLSLSSIFAAKPDKRPLYMIYSNAIGCNYNEILHLSSYAFLCQLHLKDWMWSRGVLGVVLTADKNLFTMASGSLQLFFLELNKSAKKKRCCIKIQLEKLVTHKYRDTNNGYPLLCHYGPLMMRTLRIL